MTSRRTALLGIAALPLASLPTLAAPSAPDAFLNIHRRISEARAYANKDGVVGDEFEAAMDRLRDIEREGGETPPTTIEGAIVGLEWARYEHIEFGDPDVGIVLAMIDGALDVLRGLAHV